MADFFQWLINWMVGLHPFLQGYIMCLIVTGVPGPLNLIAVHKTISGHTRDAWHLSYHFAGWFAIVALFTYFLNGALFHADLISDILIYSQIHKSNIMYILAAISVIGGIFFFNKKVAFRKTKHSIQLLMVILFTGIVFNPFNWLVFTSSYASIAQSMGHSMPIPDMLIILVGVFAFGMTSWGITILAAKGARHWIIRKIDGDHDALERILNKLIGTLLFTLAVLLLFLA